jgi:hypothetical protein
MSEQPWTEVSDMTFVLLVSSLEVAVPVWIERLRTESWESIDRRRPSIVNMIVAHGDDILYKSKKPGETAAAFNALAEGIAMLAFLPGGIRAFGLHFEAHHSGLAS